MIVAAHQPNFLPWLGFFDKMRRADLFVIVDHVQFERQNYQNRARIKADEGVRWLTVPVRHVSQDETILEKKLCLEPGGRHDWRRKARLTLEQSYARTSHFKAFAPPFLDALESAGESLAELNIRLIELARRALGIQTILVRSSTLGITGLKSQMVLNLCEAVGADAYLAGGGGSRLYLDLPAFAESGVQVVWQDFKHPVYPQEPSRWPFAPGLSVVDMLFNCGPESGAVLAAQKRRAGDLSVPGPKL